MVLPFRSSVGARVSCVTGSMVLPRIISGRLVPDRTSVPELIVTVLVIDFPLDGQVFDIAMEKGVSQHLNRAFDKIDLRTELVSVD